MLQKTLKKILNELESQFKSIEQELTSEQKEEFKCLTRCIQDISEIALRKYHRRLRVPILLPWKESEMDLLWNSSDYALLMSLSDPDELPEYIFYNKTLRQIYMGKV